MDSDVLVVGAGPVGLTMATELVRHGLRVRIVDQLAAPPQYAKAVGIQPRTLEMWERSGLLTDVLDEAIPMRGQIVYADGVQVGRMDMALPPDVPFGFMALPQYVTERLVAAQLARHGGTVERSVELVGFEQDVDGVTARLRTPDGERVERATFLVGADGAHSVVRKGLGLDFSGDAFAEEYMLGDVEVDWDQPLGYALRSIRRRDGLPDDVLVAIPLPGRRRYRLSMLAPPELATVATGEVAHGMEAGQAPELHHLQAVLDRLAPEPATAHTLRWSSVFRISHRIVDRYGEGRVFVAGDAAHIHPPTGAQGMNTGIQDAMNLAWKLALAVRGVAAPGLLESYDAERRPVGEEVVGRTVRHARAGFEADPEDPSMLMRREAQLLVNYRRSPLVCDDVGSDAVPRDAPRPAAPMPGDRAPDCRGLRRPAVTDPVRLFSVLAGTAHTLLYVADRLEHVDAVPALVAAVGDWPAPLRLFVVLAPSLDVDPLRVGAPCLLDDGEFTATYDVRGGDGVVVRPDGYLGLVARPLTAAGLAEHLARVAGPALVPAARTAAAASTA
jgi:2-polyprenyl-6-methoxyphenol hydroxylase-like FAD-dependent oxidoreductase